MKKMILMLAGALLLCSCGAKKSVTLGDKSNLDTLSYAIGNNIGSNSSSSSI